MRPREHPGTAVGVGRLCYEPASMPFSEVIAQERALAALQAALRRGALHHAYLFGGPRGTGKARTALLFAQAANCQEGEAFAGGYRIDPCGTCRSCRNIQAGNHPDVIMLSEERVMAKAGRWEPRSGRSPSKDIVVDQIRDLLDHRLSLKRYEGRRRFVIIDPAEAMNPQAQNALLKTLEEPPDDTTLVLASGSPDSLLPTIRSRCLRVAFGPIPDDLLRARLEKEGHSPEEALLAVALAGGSLGRALSLKTDALDVLRDAVLKAAALDPGDALGWLAYAKDHGKDREEAGELCELLGIWLRDVLAAQAGFAGLSLLDLSEETRLAATKLTAAEVVRRRGLVTDTARALRQNASPTLALEGMLLGWFHGPA